MLQIAYAGWSSIRGNQASLADALELLDQPIPAHADATVSAQIPFNNTVTLKGLAFRYAENTPCVI